MPRMSNERHHKSCITEVETNGLKIRPHNDMSRGMEPARPPKEMGSIHSRLRNV
jgi:hypothetical protein